MRIICDFDGTVTTQDTTDLVLERFAHPAWRDLEEAWMANRISGADCMRKQVALIKATQAELDSLLREVELAPGFVRFIDWCEARAIPVSIVSDGVHDFIAAILLRHGLQHLPVIANRLRPGAAWELDQPWARTGCAAGSGVCKCHAAELQASPPPRSPAPRPTTVYVGDGRSDFCASARADILFAKGPLADYAAGRARPFHPFETFDDIRTVLARLVGEPVAPTTAANS